jgi:uncharacterized protein YxjI
MERLAVAQSLLVQQKKEWGEILTGLEHRNKYLVRDPAGSDLYAALEQGGSPLTRVLLGSFRPFKMRILALDQTTVMVLERPFRWYFHETRLVDAKQRQLGSVRREFSLLRRVYSVRDATGRELYKLHGPLLHPWTFEIRQGEKTLGRIVKKWSGLGREAFTKADSFGITFPTGADARTKALLLGAVFLIDFVHFENSRG